MGHCHAQRGPYISHFACFAHRKVQKAVNRSRVHTQPSRAARSKVNDIHKRPKMATVTAASLLLVLLTVSSLAMPETGGKSDSSIPLVVPNALGTFDWSEDWRSLYDVRIGKEPVSEERAHEGSQVTRDTWAACGCSLNMREFCLNTFIINCSYQCLFYSCSSPCS